MASVALQFSKVTMLFKPTSVYFAKCIGPNGHPIGAIKIGCSTNAALRAKGVASGQPYTCEVLATTLGGFLDEAVLHEWLRTDRIRGEFFRESDEINRLIASARETLQFPLPVEGDIRLVRGISPAGVKAFMAVHDLDVQGAVALTGRRATFFKAGLLQHTPPRALVASLAVAAIRKGHGVHWNRDFMITSESIGVAA